MEPVDCKKTYLAPEELTLQRKPVEAIPLDAKRFIDLLNTYVEAREELREFLQGARPYVSALRTLYQD